MPSCPCSSSTPHTMSRGVAPYPRQHNNRPPRPWWAGIRTRNTRLRGFRAMLPLTLPATLHNSRGRTLSCCSKKLTACVLASCLKVYPAYLGPAV
eukprot:scaffold75740_cov36-Tisochrysis_lutea.AAC.2